ncbi:ankyrin repeat domain-containing protein [Flagellimonas sp.]|uniref:ankyrin repeat domain-containing protein n=1 Tax=Flagellimonas sp. TaxID=2058762 RepID=UPI003F4A647C
MVFLFKASLVILILWLFYKLLLERESFFAVNRIYLLASLLMVFLLPFISLPEMAKHQGVVDNLLVETPLREPSKSFVSPVESKPENVRSTDYVIGSEENSPINVQPSQTKGIEFWLFSIYVFGVIVLTAHLLFQLATVFIQIRRTHDKVDDVDCTIVNLNDDNGPRSFFKYVLLNPKKYNSETYEQILEHEKIHVKMMHTIDLLIAEIAIIILWFNPIIWFFRKEVEKNIEYQTDALLLKSTAVETEKYQLNLIEISVERKPLTIVSNYNQSLIKKRIVMMNKKKSNTHSYWKYAFIAPTLVITLLVLNQPLSAKVQQKVVSTGENNLSESFENEYDDLDRDLAPLLYAVRRGDFEQVKKLVNEGADINFVQEGEGTALVLAIRHNELKIARYLLENGADPNLGTDSDGHPLWLAARNGNIGLVELLVSKGVDVNKKFYGDGSALIQACKNGDMAMVKALVRLKADINMGVRGDGSPLIMASKGGHFNIVEYLVGLGADVNQEVKGDETPLINASEQGHLDIVKFLVEKGADVNKICTEKRYDGSIRVRTALSMADKKGHDSIVRYLKSKGAKAN